jgi:hypothetical protein
MLGAFVMGLSDDLQILAFAEVTAKEKSADYSIRYIMRWYSKTFHTPLHLVQTLQLTDILTAYFESRYEQMDELDLAEERKELLKSDEERAAEAAAEANVLTDDALLAQLEIENANTGRPIEQVKVRDTKPIKTREKVGEVGLPQPDRSLPENVSIKFAPDTNFFDEMLDRLDEAGSGSGPEQSSKKLPPR